MLSTANLGVDRSGTRTSDGPSDTKQNTADDQKHVGFFEAKHLLYAELGGHLGLDQHHAEVRAYDDGKQIADPCAPPMPNRSNRITVNTPPTKKLIVATRLGYLRFDMPMMEWPEVQPSAYRVPKPTSSPPTNRATAPLHW